MTSMILEFAKRTSLMGVTCRGKFFILDTTDPLISLSPKTMFNC